MIDLPILPNETEAETRKSRIDPVLVMSGWDGTHKIDGALVRCEEMLWPGRKASGGKRHAPKPADYVLRMNGHVLAVMEAKKATLPYTDGRAQALEYAKRIDARFAYCTNGIHFYEIDRTTGKEQEISEFPSPHVLWNRCYPTGNAWRDRLGQIPFETDGGKWQPRYYQSKAVNAVLEAIASNEKRILLTLATGTGKTAIAFQIAWKLFHARWNLSGKPKRRPRILFLADRNILANQAFNSFSAFDKDALCRINPKEISKKSAMPRNASVFFTIFQTFMTKDKNGKEDFNFRAYEPDFFDFIIIDECHRGGAKDESTWRNILEYFEPAVQLGLTATPKRQGNADTYSYFGEPVYTYALRDGIDDGFLTPFKVRQMASTLDKYTYDPDDEIISGEIDQDREYREDEINTKIIIPEREQSRIHEFMDQINPRQKTLVFCATQEHAASVRDYINQIKDIDDPHYCERVTANDGELGEKHLRQFQDNERSIPTILTTSQKLSTGVDARNVRNIVLMRPVKSMIEFKQIVGRGTRTFEGKDFFTVYDFVKAYEHFNDPEWDGEPLPPETTQPRTSPANIRPEGARDAEETEPTAKVKIKLADGKERKIVYIATTSYYSKDGKIISAQEFMQQLFGDLGDLVKDEDDLRTTWSNPETRINLLKILADRGYDSGRLEDMKLLVDAPNSDIFDVLAYVRFTLAPLHRSDRAQTARQSGLPNYESEMRAFLEAVLSAYETHGVNELAPSKISDFLKVKYGGTNGAKKALGDIPKIKQAFTEIQAHLYAN